MKKLFLVFAFLTIVIYANAQNIKTQAEQQKRQQQYEREQRANELKEAARIKKTQLNLNNLLQLLQSKDLDYVDRYLTERGWKLHSTNVKEEDDYNEEAPTGYKTVTWSLDKNLYNDLAKGWFYFWHC